MNKVNPLNPLCKSYPITKVDSFEVYEILNRYMEQGLDVSRFFDGIKQIDLFECQKTGYRFYYPFASIGDAEFYKDLSLNRKNYYSTRWEHLKILPTLNVKEKVLEIGSGFGDFLKLLKAKGFKAEGIELNPEAITVCEKEGLKIHSVLIDEFAKQYTSKFDVVCYFQVLEHITNVHDFLKDSLMTLKPGGKLIVGVPNNNPYLFVNDKYHTLNLPPHHAGLWNKKSLTALERIFHIKVESLSYEPLEKTYSQFLKTYIQNSKPIYAKLLKVVHVFLPSLLKKVLCKCIDGRNILVVFRKLS
jgi:SAM-dependent methyltransferase